MPLPQLIEYFNLQFMHQYVNVLLPPSFNDLWITQEARRQTADIVYTLRNSNNFYIPPSKLSSLDRHPYFLFPRLWHNCTLEDIKITRTKNSFNLKLKKHFINNLRPIFTCDRLLCPHCHLRVAGGDSDCGQLLIFRL